MSVKFKCECCGHEQEFPDARQAYRMGWDVPPYFTTPVSCDLCPAVCVVLGLSHEKAHEYWAKHGRPASFNELCHADKDFGKVVYKEIQ